MPAALLASNEADRLEALRSYQILDTDCDGAIENLVSLAARLTGCPTALVSLVDENRQWFKARHGLSATETPRDAAFCAHAILNPGQPLVVPDATADARFADNPLVSGEPGIRFYAGMPLVTEDGHALGTLCVIDYVPKALGVDDLEALRGVSQVVMSILNFRHTTGRLRTLALSINDRFARVVEALPTALVISGRSGTIRLINRQAERLFGYDRSELLGRPLEVLLPERYRIGHVDLRQAFMAGTSSRVMGGEQALFGLRKDGSEFSLEIGLNPIDLDDELMMLAAIVDVSARQETERAKDQARRELERSNDDLQEFAYAASHDLKAPLRAIGHLAEWIREDVAPTASADTIDNLALLQGRVERLQMLLDGLLIYSRVGLPEAEVEDVDIAEMIDDIAAMLTLPPGFSVVCETTMPVIRTHRAPIRMVLHNLISNGWQHHDRAEGRIAVAMSVRGRVAEFRVSDDGAGIPKQFQDRVFVIFQTLVSRDKKESTGIGLALVKKKVESYGGKITIESDPPARGTTFVFNWELSLS